jgi:2-desacetyl-2-hydroxyethyl bacteriochlorophyllide A dehydrogenase
VLVRTLYSGISSGTETLAYRGELDPSMPIDEVIATLRGTFTYPFPYGYSCVGVVEEGADLVAEGDLVFAFHPHQDAFVAAASDVVLLRSRDARAATLFPLVETALQTTLDAGAVHHEEVLVYGLGPVGLLTCLLLTRAGASVLAAEPMPWRRSLAASLGIDAVSPPEVTARLAAAAEGGVSLAVEASGNPDALADALGALRREGTVLVASWYGSKPVHLELGGEFHRRRLCIRSTQVSTMPAALAARWSIERRRRAALALLETLPLRELATHEFPFTEAPRAYEAIERGEPGLMHAALRYG